jgi:hypothetical protein
VRQDSRFNGHRQREPTGDAHPDRADTGPAAIHLGLHGQRPQPVHDRADPVRQQGELSRATHTRPSDRITAPVVTGTPGRPNRDGR